MYIREVDTQQAQPNQGDKIPFAKNTICQVLI